MFTKLLQFSITQIPGLVMLVIFMISVNVPFYDYDFEPFEKSLALVTFGPGIAFETREELPYTILISILIVGMSALILARKFSTADKLNVTDLFLVISMFFVFLIFHSKNGDFGGMFVERQLCLFFFFLILWVACNSLRGYIMIVAAFIVFFVFIHVSIARYDVAAKAQKTVMEVISARPFIREKSIVKTINLSKPWFNVHISDYLGIGREVLLLENYEATLDWFPFSWSEKVLDLRNKGKELESDYIFVYGNDTTKWDEYDTNKKSELSDKCHLIYTSPDKFCRLFECN